MIPHCFSFIYEFYVRAHWFFFITSKYKHGQNEVICTRDHFMATTYNKRLETTNGYCGVVKTNLVSYTKLFFIFFPSVFP